MATSTILEPIRINDTDGAAMIVEALESAESNTYSEITSNTITLTRDPATIREVANSAMARMEQ